jgi:hypothetical protein
MKLHKVGDQFEDNDPRVVAAGGRRIKVTEVLPATVDGRQRYRVEVVASYNRDVLGRSTTLQQHTIDDRYVKITRD